MRDRPHYARLLNENPNAGVGFSLAASAVYAARYGETLTPDEVRQEMDAPITA